jgi:VWFA-related protein
MKTGMACWPTMLLLISVPVGQQRPSQAPPSFRTGVDVVPLDVTVLDEQRRPVRGLTAADFTVFEEGKPRKIVAFSVIELPPIPALGASSTLDTISADVSSNDDPEGRLVVILIDPFLERPMEMGRVTIADPPGVVALRATAHRIVDSLGTGDLAAVTHTIYGSAQNFTSDKASLTRAIDSSAFATNKRAEGEEWGNCYCGVCRLDAITSIATALRDESHRRKVVFFIGERVRLAPTAGSCNSYLEPATRRMISATQLANVTVNTIDPNALETTNVHAGDDFRPERPVSEQAAAQEKANRASLIERQQSSQAIADLTGGRAILNTNSPEESVRSILDESSAYYLLALQASDVEADGRFHTVSVKVNRPGLHVYTRKGYYADAVSGGDTAAAAALSLEDVTRALLPERGIPMTVSAAPFRDADGNAAVVVATGVRAAAAKPDVTVAPPAVPPAFEPIEILTSAIADGAKEALWQRQRLSVALSQGAPGDLRYESIATLHLKPGRYEVRVASRHERADVIGSVHTFVDVPDFDHQPLTLSGLVLFDVRAPTATPAEALGGIVDAAPTTRREFTTADDVSAFVRVYQKPGMEPSEVAVAFRILDDKLREVDAELIVFTPDQFTPTAAVDAHFALPLDLLPPGSYVLRLEASTATVASRSRDLRFRVK